MSAAQPQPAHDPDHSSDGNADQNADQRPRLSASLRQLASTASSMLHTRLALAGLEIEEELTRLTRLLMSFVGLLVFGFLGLLVVTFAVVWSVDVHLRMAALLGFCVLYLGFAAWFGWKIRQLVRQRPPLLQLTLAELAQDRETLRQALVPDTEAVGLREAPKP